MKAEITVRNGIARIKLPDARLRRSVKRSLCYRDYEFRDGDSANKSDHQLFDFVDEVTIDVPSGLLPRILAICGLEQMVERTYCPTLTEQVRSVRHAVIPCLGERQRIEHLLKLCEAIDAGRIFVVCTNHSIAKSFRFHLSQAGLRSIYVKGRNWNSHGCRIVLGTMYSLESNRMPSDFETIVFDDAIKNCTGPLLQSIRHYQANRRYAFLMDEQPLSKKQALLTEYLAGAILPAQNTYDPSYTLNLIRYSSDSRNNFDISRRELAEKLWNCRRRNQAIVDCVNANHTLRTALVVDSPIQANHLQRLLPDWTVLTESNGTRNDSVITDKFITTRMAARKFKSWLVHQAIDCGCFDPSLPASLLGASFLSKVGVLEDGTTGVLSKLTLNRIAAYKLKTTATT